MPALVVASANPVKIQAVLAGFQRMFPAQAFTARGLPAESGVSHQPMTDAETRQGARNRAAAARRAAPEADFWAGVEGGCEALDGQLACFAWVVILGRAQSGESRTGLFFLPEAVAGLVRQGVELGAADDQVFGRVNSKQGNGAVGLLTGDVIDRLAYYEHAVALALVPFKNPALYPVISIE
ncbi:MAG: inosine/xanthosine triphosphatase [Anaerolineales bacterium]|nr:inosine/xanthosine triphosphatase [Anaerolineales bacterium]